MLTANPKRWAEPAKLIKAVTETVAKGLKG
jgi:hypothetical protein